MYLASCGLVTPVGLSFPAATAAMRAGIAAFGELPYHDGRGRPTIGAEVPDIVDGWRGTERLVRLLAPAIRECLQQARIEDITSIPILFNVAEAEAAGRPAALASQLPAALATILGAPLHPRSALMREGRTGAAHALRLVSAMFAAGHERCMITGVDSLISAQSIAALAACDRLKTQLNPDGLIPGEAAAAILVTTAPFSEAAAPIRIAGIGFGFEEVRPESDEPVLGLGLASALREALAEAGLDIADAAARVSDLTGEKYFFAEASYALGRLLRRRKPEFPLWHPMDSIGDSGAAAGLCLLAIAMAALTKGYSLGSILLCQMSAESGDRAAVIVKAED